MRNPYAATYSPARPWLLLSALLLVFGNWPALSQSRLEDSLRRVVSTAEHDTSRARVLWLLSQYAESNDSTIRLTQRALAVLDRVESSRWPLAARNRVVALRAACYVNQAIGYGNLGTTALVEPAYLEALRRYRQIGDHEGEATTLNNLGVQTYIVGDIRRALVYEQRALQIAQRHLTGTAQQKRIASCLVDLGVLYFRQGDAATALRYHLRAADLHALAADKISQADALSRAAAMALHLGDTARTEAIAQQCLALAKEKNDADTRRDALDLLGQLAFARHQLLEARTHHREALRIDEENGMSVLVANDLVALARVEHAARNLPLALRYGQRAADVAQAANSLTALQNAEQQLAALYEKTGDTGKALRHFQRFTNLRDSVRNKENDRATLQQRLGYEYELKETTLRATQQKRQSVARAEIARQKLLRNAFLAGAAVLLLLAGLLWQRFRFTRRAKQTIEREKLRSDALLLNILPADTAEELKQHGRAQARRYEQATVLFADVVNFTSIASEMTPEKLVSTLDTYFAAFDRLSEEFGLEKIKTIGDCYMTADGLNGSPSPAAAVRCALAMQALAERLAQERSHDGEPAFVWRIGLHTGPVVAGVVGLKKFAYDIWGDTVNMAARMEQSGQGGRINISEATWELVSTAFVCTPRGRIAAKHKGEIEMYFVEGELVSEQLSEPASELVRESEGALAVA